MNQYQLQNRADKRDKAYNLHKTGLTIAQIALLVEQSVGWVHGAIREAKELEELMHTPNLNNNEQGDIV